MKITVKVSELSKKVQKVQGVISAKITIPILEYIKVDVTSVNQATLSGSDLGTSMIQTVPIELQSTEPGVLMIKARVLSQLLAPLPLDGVVTIEREADGAVMISMGKLLKKSKLNGQASALFPAIEARPATQFNVNAAALRKVLSRVDAASPAKAGRHSVPSVLISSTADILQAAATDGSRIAVAHVKGAGAGDFSFQIPKTFVPLLKDIAGEVIQFSKSENNLFFATEHETLAIRIPATQFPNFQKVFAIAGFKSTFDVPVPSLKTALQIVGATSDSKTPAVYLEVSGGELTVSSANSEGATDSAIEIKLDGVSNKVKVNQVFVQDFLGQAEGVAKIELIDAGSLIKFSNGDDYLYFLMPMSETPKEEPAAKETKKAS